MKFEAREVCQLRKKVSLNENNIRAAVPVFAFKLQNNDENLPSEKVLLNLAKELIRFCAIDFVSFTRS